MAQIKNFPLDTTISGSDTLLGNDGNQSNKTKLFKISDLISYILSSIGGDGGDIGSFKFKLLEYTDAQQITFPTFVDFINNRGVDTILISNEVLIVYSDNITLDSAWMFLKGTGTYGGITGTPVVGTDFIKIYEKFNDTQNIKLNQSFPTLGISSPIGFFQSDFNNAIFTLANTQADWNITDNTNPAFIKNKPTLVNSGAQSDWNITDNLSAAFIKNKPTSTSSFINNGSSGVPYAITTQVDGKESIGVAQTLVNSHATNFNNPHNVNASQLGLSAVATTGSYNSLNDKPTIPPVLSIRTQALPYTLVNADKGKILLITNAGTLTVPNTLTGDFEVGIIQTAPTSSVVNITGSGATVNMPNGMTTNIFGQNSQAYIVGSGSLYYLFGDLKKS